MANTTLAYEIRPLNPPEDMRPAATLQCAGCDVKGKLPIMGFGNNPEKIQQAFIRLGWRCDVHKASGNFCPKCMKEKAVRAEAAAKRNDEQRKEEKQVELRAFTRTPVSTASSPQMVEVRSLRDLTPDQKFKLRQSLDHSFDDSSGRYIDGHTDHTVSERLGIPRAIVIEFRELMYGPLKEDPLVTNLRDQLSEAKKALAGIQSDVAKMELLLAEVAKKNGP